MISCARGRGLLSRAARDNCRIRLEMLMFAVGEGFNRGRSKLSISFLPRRAVVTNQEIREMTDKKEVLVVASKVKTYVREKSDMNTSAGIFDVISDKIRATCDRAIENARNDGRKTVKDRDFS